MLDTFITSRVRRKIIVVYAKYPDFKTHVRGLAKLIKEDAGNIQRELKRLKKNNITYKLPIFAARKIYFFITSTTPLLIERFYVQYSR
jgi:endonuclease V-like protein UPF0215 family